MYSLPPTLFSYTYPNLREEKIADVEKLTHIGLQAITTAQNPIPRIVADVGSLQCATFSAH